MSNIKEFPDSDYFSEETRKKLLHQLLIASEDKLSSDEFEFAFAVLVENRNFYETARRLKIPALNQKITFNSIIATLTKSLKSYKNYIDRDFRRKNNVPKQKTSVNPKNKRKISTEAFLELNISETQLSPRIKSICTQARIKKVKKLYSTYPEKLLEIPRCGRKSLIDIDEFFLKRGLNWIK